MWLYSTLRFEFVFKMGNCSNIFSRKYLLDDNESLQVISVTLTFTKSIL